MNYDEKIQKAYGENILEYMDNLKIIHLYIIDENRYLFNVAENYEEVWYMVNGSNFKKLKIKNTDYTEYDSIIYTLEIDNCGIFELEQYSQSIIMNDIDYDSILDIYLYKMFYDIHRMNNSS